MAFFPLPKKRKGKNQARFFSGKVSIMNFKISLFLLVALAIWWVDSYKIGNVRYVTITVDFSLVPQAPATQVVWTPPKGRWWLDWNAMVVDTSLISFATVGTLVTGGLGDWNAFNDQATDMQYFFFGNSTHFENIMHGPFWGDSFEGISFTPGSDLALSSVPYFLTGQMALYAPDKASNRGQQIEVSRMNTIQIMRQQGGSTTYDPEDWIWGQAPYFSSHSGSWTVPPARLPADKEPYIVYSQANPLKISFAVAEATAPGTSTGTIKFTVRALKIA